MRSSRYLPAVILSLASWFGPGSALDIIVNNDDDAGVPDSGVPDDGNSEHDAQIDGNSEHDAQIDGDSGFAAGGFQGGCGCEAASRSNPLPTAIPLLLLLLLLLPSRKDTE